MSDAARAEKRETTGVPFTGRHTKVRRCAPEWIAVAVVCAALPPPALHAALAAAAGTLFEAAPFVLAAGLDLGRRFRFGRVLLRLAGCGCDGRGFGALGLPALALCWFAFGPLVAALRAAAVLAVVAVSHRFPRGGDAPASDPLAELDALAPQALAGALLALWLPNVWPLSGVPPAVGNLLAFVLGAALGVLSPCATGAVAIAATLRHVAPFASAGLLATAGIFALRRKRDEAPPRSARAGFALLALACGSLAVRGPSGFVNPRFMFPLAAAALASLAYAVRERKSTARRTLAAPAALLAATIAGSPLPNRAPAATTLDDPYPGAAVRFLGAVAGGANARSGTTLVRYTITCCRADAQARAVQLDRTLAGPAGRWYDVAGMLVRDASGALVLHPATVRGVPAPQDPFAYR